MPGFTTHYLFGVNNIRKLRSEAACRYLLQSIDEYKTVFQLGLQGPDIFFYHLPSQLRKIRPGSIVHTRSTGRFYKMPDRSTGYFSEGRAENGCTRLCCRISRTLYA